jgi:ribosomal protein S18 acetylase RimI-like enzyme
MGKTIQEINAENSKDLNRVDGTFIIDSRLDLYIEEGQIQTQITEIPRTIKRYRVDPINVTGTIKDPDKTVFFAYVDKQIAGQIILRVNWNNFASIKDIAVDTNFRRQGIGTELISWAQGWARERELAGIMLETQNNNLPACKLYERCGFRLAGFDQFLYKGIDKDTDEIALYWYLLL